MPLTQSGAVFAAVNRIATQVASIPIKVLQAPGINKSSNRRKILDLYYSGLKESPEFKYKKAIKEKYVTSGAIEERDDHWLLELLYRPNPQMVQYNFMLNSITKLMHDGSVFWVNNRSSQGKITELWVKPQSEFTPVGEDGRITHWVRKGTKIELNRLSRLYLLQDPRDETKALSPLRAISSELNQAHFASVYNEAFFENGGTIGDIFTTEQELSKEQREELTATLRSRHGGPGQAHKTLFLDGGLKPFLGKNHKDMEFTDQQKWVVQMVRMIYGIPESIMGGGSGEGKDFYESKIAFFEICIIPILRYLSEQMHNDFFRGTKDDNSLVVYDLARVEGLRGSLVDATEAAKNLLGAGFSRNEVNARYDMGFEDTTWGGEALANGALRACSKLAEAKVESGSQVPVASDSPHAGNPDGNTVSASLQGLADLVTKDFSFLSSPGAISYLSQVMHPQKIKKLDVADELRNTQERLKLLLEYLKNSGLDETQLKDALPLLVTAELQLTYVRLGGNSV